MEQHLRSYLAEQLKSDPKADPVFEKIWRTLVSEDHVEAAKQLCVMGDDEEEIAKGDLLKTAKLLLPYAKFEVGSGSRKVVRRKSPRRQLRLDGYEKDRAIALGEYLAFRVSMHPLVRRFRKDILGDEYLTPEQAYALVDSDVANRFPLWRFRQLGIPVLGHTANFYEHGTVSKAVRMDKFIEFEYIFVDPPGKLFRAHLPVSVAYEELEYLWFPNRHSRIVSDGDYTSVARDSEYVPTPVYPGSILDDLRQLSQRLMVEYGRCWDEAQAAWFVLTGEPLSPKAITATYHDHGSEHLTHGTVTLIVEPWVPAETVTKFYQHLQAEMLWRKPRAPERRNLAVFRFVNRQLRASLFDEEPQSDVSTQPPWRKLMERWNQENPDQRYSRKSRYIRDFHRGGRAVLAPYDHMALLGPIRLSVP